MTHFADQSIVDVNQIAAGLLRILPDIKHWCVSLSNFDD